MDTDLFLLTTRSKKINPPKHLTRGDLAFSIPGQDKGFRQAPPMQVRKNKFIQSGALKGNIDFQ